MQVEESYIDAGKLCDKAKQDEALVLKGEIILLEALGFDLVVFNAYRPLQGFLMVGSTCSRYDHCHPPLETGKPKHI